MSSAANNSAQSRPTVTGRHDSQWAAGGVEGWLHFGRKALGPASTRPRGASQLLAVPQFTACKTRMGRPMERDVFPLPVLLEHSWECVC